jgi:HPt (histidine-containing phosphotransfer) domain-containing protein
MEMPIESKLLYLERRKKDVDDCMTALMTGDYEVLARVGHQIRGNAVTFGYGELTQIGEILEDSARSRNKTTAQTQVVALQQFLANVVIK